MTQFTPDPYPSSPSQVSWYRSAQSPVIYNRNITERATLRLVTRVLVYPTMAIVNGQGVHFSGAGLVHSIYETPEEMPEDIRPRQEFERLTETLQREMRMGWPDVPISVAFWASHS